MCTNSVRNSSFTPMNSLVPSNTVFLSIYPTYQYSGPFECRERTFRRRGTINVGRQTVFFPLTNGAFLDITDDWKLGIRGCATSASDAELRRKQLGRAKDAEFNDPFGVKTMLYVNIDGVPSSPFYIYDDAEFYMSACEDGRTTKEYATLAGLGPDYCDMDFYQAIGGLDSYLTVVDHRSTWHYQKFH